MANLKPLSDDDKRIFDLGLVTTLGRESGNTVTLHDPLVSRKHATIQCAPDGRYVLTDLGSMHGTYVGGKRISSAVLGPGDEIRIGATRLLFQPGKAPSHTAPQSILDTEWIKQRITMQPEERFRAEREIDEVAQVRREYERLRAAYQITRSIGIEHNVSALLGRVLDTAFELTTGDRGVAVLVDPLTQTATSKVSRLRTGLPADVPISQTLIAEVMLTRSGIISGNVGLDQRFDRSGSLADQHIRSTICVPLLYREETLGFIQLDSQVAAEAFGQKDLELLTTVANQAALALKNVTLQQQITTVMSEEQRRLERVVKGLPTGVLLLDSHSRIVLSNLRADALLPMLTCARRGDALDALGGTPLSELCASADPVELTVGPRGSQRYFMVSAATGEGPLGSRGETVISLSDVTDTREQEQRSARADRMTLVGQLAGGVAHDFNNLLSVILSYSDFLRESITDPEAQEDIDQIREAGLRAAALTRQLLAFSRREVVSPQVVDCNRVVSGMVSLLERTLGEDVQLSQVLGTSLASVNADPGRLEQVLMNLVVNARDAMPDGGHLTVETSNFRLNESRNFQGEQLAAGNYVMISVADTGCGMSSEIASRVFEPFFTTKERGKGTGLGLATVYGIVKQAGGSVWVESEIGLGSTFRICLPATRETMRSVEAVEKRQPAPRGAELILVVEDEDSVRAMTVRILKAAGYQVIQASCAQEAMDVCGARAAPVDLLLTDLVMPGLSGQELARKLTQMWSGLPVLFMTGYTESALRAGCDGPMVRVVEKPFRREELLSRIREVIDAAASTSLATAAPSARFEQPGQPELRMLKVS